MEIYSLVVQGTRSSKSTPEVQIKISAGWAASWGFSRRIASCLFLSCWQLLAIHAFLGLEMHLFVLCLCLHRDIKYTGIFPVCLVSSSSVSVQFSCSVMFNSLQPPWTAACQATLSITNSQSLLKLMSIQSVMLSNHLILCHLLLLTSTFSSNWVFSNESALCIRWPKYWRFSFSISPPSEYSRLISFTIDWFDLLAVQGTLKSLIQHHSSKASILQCSTLIESNSHINTWPLEKPQLWLDGPLLAKWCLCFLICCLGLS